MDEQGQTIKDKLAQLRRMVPKRDGLHLYRVKAEKTRPTKAATLFVYIRSDDNTYALHETFFRRNRAMSPLEWTHFISTKVLKGTGTNAEEPAIRLGILGGAIIPGVNIRSQKIWDVRAVIGFVTHDLHKSIRTQVSKGRYKAKSSRGKNGQNHLRRGHRNRPRKAK